MAVIVTLFVVCFATSALSAGQAPYWDYGDQYGPANWRVNYSDCGGSRQSPINIQSRLTKLNNAFSSNVQISVASAIPATLANNGHVMQATLNANQVVRVTGGPLAAAVYQVAQYHLHFAVNETQGSEHTVDGVQTPAELHIVTFNTKFGNLSNALDKPEGLAVLGVMVQVGATDYSSDLKTLFTESAKLMYNGQSSAISLTLQNLLPQDFASNLYFYDGSLTTPPCGEVVHWLLCRQFVTLTQDTIDGMASIYTGSNAMNPGVQMSGNHRPPQPLAGRTVSLFTGASGASATGPAFSAIVLASLVVMFKLF